MKTKKQYKIYAPQIVDGGELRSRINAISQKTGKKIYQIVKEALEIGLDQIESQEKL